MVMMLNVGRIVGDLRGGKEDMTNKRFIVIDVPYENGEPFLYKKILDKTTKKNILIL